MKTKLALLFGGTSPEHEGSLFSTYNTLRNIDTDKYELLPVAITKTGELWTGPADKIVVKTDVFKLVDFHTDPSFTKLVFALDGTHGYFAGQDELHFQPDVIFPLIHGRGGEDGSVYGLCQYANIPCVGAGILGSAATMNKAATKRLLRQANIPVAKFELITIDQVTDQTFQELTGKLGTPLFVKPVDSGSSIGLHKVTTQQEFTAAVEDIRQYTRQILAEEFIDGREIECAVLGNTQPQVTVPGEVVTNQEFYDYDTKMYAAQNLELKIPAELDEKLIQKAKDMALAAYTACFCQDLARVDFFLTADGQLLVNEINAMPGFADMSLYPLLWEHEGTSRSELFDQLVNLALERKST